MGKEQTKLLVTKANDLVSATYRLTLNEQRLILSCIAQLDARKPAPRDLITIRASDFAEQFGIDLRHAYEALEDAANSLYERDIRQIRGSVRERVRWVYKVQYHDGEGKVSLGFSPDVTPYLTLLHKRFTTYYLHQVSALRSTYSIRLFEMLAQYAETGLFTISVDAFRERLELGDKYDRFANLKARVIQPAVDELRQKSSLEIDWRTERRGRVVNRLVFEFREQPQGQLQL